MVLVDTSVWISLFRKENDKLGQKMWVLISENRAAFCGQVWVEFIGGFRKETERREHEKALRSFPFLETNLKAYQLAAHLLAKYPHLGSGDAIIAATALENKVPLLTLDKDFFTISTEGLKLS
ncbi:MAG: PIN domain-containing protein [Deltaproteobacteria bacterium]|nr:PIN domain-containing protein [Deltaproteobacteria bacterium]